MDILGPDRGKMTIYGSDFQQVNLTPNGGVSPTVKQRSLHLFVYNFASCLYGCAAVNRVTRLGNSKKCGPRKQFIETGSTWQRAKR